MRAGVAILVILLGAGVAGCISDGETAPPVDPGVIDHDAIADLIGLPIELDHDHNDVSAHTGSFNLDFVSWTTLGVRLGENGFANFVFYEDDDEDLLFMASDGTTTGGFIIADVSDPRNIVPLGRHWIDGNQVQEVRVTSDGRYAAINVQSPPSVPGAIVDGPGGDDCTVCIQLYNVEDRSSPVLEAVLPVDLLGTHNMHFEDYDDGTYLFYVGQPLTNDPPGNYIGIAQLVETPAGASLVKVAEYRHDVTQDSGRTFPHDVIVTDHPLTGQKIAWVSHWDGGAITVDVTDPMNPVELDIVAEAAPSGALAVHWYAPEPNARSDGRLIAWSAPEIGTLDTDPGVIRAYDASDPADVKEIGHWMLPGDLQIPGRYLLSPHITHADMTRGLLAVSHYHAGVWILDITDPTTPRHLAYYLPHGDPEDIFSGPYWWKANFNPDGFLPNVFQARWNDDLLWVSERGTGLYVLDYTGPVPGPIGEPGPEVG